MLELMKESTQLIGGNADMEVTDLDYEFSKDIVFDVVKGDFDPIEDGKTFIENATIKAKEAAKIMKTYCLADDSGLCVDALEGKPGIHSARYAENQKYLALKNKWMYKWENHKRMREQKKIYHIYHCPYCKQKIRIPKGKGSIIITCPKCKQEFGKRS